MTFYGNPNAKITAIDISGGITCSRTSGQTPCFIQVSANAITCTGTIVDTSGNTLSGHSVSAFQDLEYSWDFGDALSIEAFTVRGGPRRGTSINANNGQIGPKAVHCYRSAGTYTITLTVRGKNGTGFTTASVTRAITVSAFSASGGTYYFDSVAGNDSNDGLSSGAPKQSISAINSAMAPNRTLLFKRGSNWVGATGVTLDDDGPLRIDAYGSGSDPIINRNTGAGPTMRLQPGAGHTGTHGDFVISNIDLWRSGDMSEHIFIAINSAAGATYNDIYLDNVDCVSAVSSGTATEWCNFQIFGNNGSRAGMWGGSLTSQPGDTARELGSFCQVYEWMFYVGLNDISGTGANAVLDHHIYPIVKNHGHYQWIKFGSGPSRNYCLNIDWDKLASETAPTSAQYHLISECEMTGTSLAHDGSDANGDTSQVRFSEFVVERNDIHDLTGGGAFFWCITSGTWRDNQFWNVPNRLIIPANSGLNSELGGLFTMRKYRNYEYAVSNPNGVPRLELTDHTFTQPQQITDNITEDTLSVARCIGVIAADQQAANSLIDRNQYLISNDSDAKGWYDNTTAKTFVQWQAFGFDINGFVADPKWHTPAAGDFGGYKRHRVTVTT